MPSESIPAPSQAAPEQGKPSDGKTSGNLSVGQMAYQLLQREAQAATPTPSVEQAAPAQTAPETAPTTPPGEVTPPSLESDPVTGNPATAPDKTNEVLSDEPSLDPKLQAAIDKRIGKEVAKRKAAEERIALLEAQMRAPQQKQPEAAPAAATPDSPLSNINDVPALAREQQSMKEIKRWAQSQLIRDDIPMGVEAYGKTWSKQDLQQAVLLADRVLEDQIPARYQFIQARAQAEQLAKQDFPWMADSSSPEFVEYQNAYRAYPWLQNVPNAPYIIGVQIAGMQALQAQKAAAAEAAKAKAAPRPSTSLPPASQIAAGGAPGSPVREPAGTAAKQKVNAELERMKQKGNVSSRDMARLLREKELSSR